MFITVAAGIENYYQLFNIAILAMKKKKQQQSKKLSKLADGQNQIGKRTLNNGIIIAVDHMAHVK